MRSARTAPCRSASACLALLGVMACYPALAHPTRVEPGIRLGAILGTSFGTDSGAESHEVTNVFIPSADLELSIGIRDTSNASAAGYRMGGMAGFHGFGVSLYTEAPRAWLGSADAGLGFAAHRGQMQLLMPYVQFGGAASARSSWFLRHGIAWVADRDSSTWSALWVPSLGYWRGSGSKREAAIWITAIVGNQPRIERDCFFFECFSGSTSFVRTSAILGFTYSFRLATP